MKFYFNVEA